MNEEELLDDMVSGTGLGARGCFGMGVFVFLLKTEVTKRFLLSKIEWSLGPLLPNGEKTDLLSIFELIAFIWVDLDLFVEKAPLLGRYLGAKQLYLGAEYQVT